MPPSLPQAPLPINPPPAGGERKKHLRSHSDAVKGEERGGRERAGRRRAASRLSWFKYWLGKGSDKRDSNRRRGCSWVELECRRKGGKYAEEGAGKKKGTEHPSITRQERRIGAMDQRRERDIVNGIDTPRKGRGVFLQCETLLSRQREFPGQTCAIKPEENQRPGERTR